MFPDVLPPDVTRPAWLGRATSGGAMLKQLFEIRV
jgi:hypothetical protein